MRAWLMGSSVMAMVLASTIAQAAPSVRQEVTIPFAFLVNGEELPAGTYSVRQDDMEGSSIVLIEGKRASAYVLTAPVERAAQPQDTSLVFTKDAGRYRLAEIWDEGEGLSIVDAAK